MIFSSGCSIKFIEKDDPEPEKTMEALPVSNDPKTNENGDPEVIWIEENYMTVAGVEFMEEKSEIPKYANETIFLMDIPSKQPGKMIQIAQGTEVTMIRSSMDLLWAEVEYQGKTWYVKQEFLTDNEEFTLPIMTDETSSKYKDFIIDTGAGNHEDQEDATENKEPTETDAEEIDTRKSNIHYPDEPSAVISLFDVNFENVKFSAIIIQGVADIYLEPSSDSTKIATFSPDSIVNCTAVGENGWSRILLPDGSEGFVETMHLMSK